MNDKDKVKRFIINKIDLFIFLFVTIILYICIFVPKNTKIYISGNSEEIYLNDFTGIIEFKGNVMGKNSINCIMGASIENIAPMKITIDGIEYAVESGELQIDINSNDKNFIANLIRFDSDVEYCFNSYCSDISINRKLIEVEECEDDIYIDLKKQEVELEVSGVYVISINNRWINGNIDSKSKIKIISNISKCLRCYHIKNLQWDNTSNVYLNGSAIDVNATFDEGICKIDQRIFQNEEQIQLVKTSLYSLSDHMFNVKNNGGKLSVSGYAKDAFLDDENLVKYGTKWLISNFPSIPIGYISFAIGLFIERIKKKYFSGDES